MRRFAGIIGKLGKMGKDIQRYGANRNQFFRNTTKPAKKLPLGSSMIMLPTSVFNRFWNLILIILLLLTATIMPYRICFESRTS